MIHEVKYYDRTFSLLAENLASGHAWQQFQQDYRGKYMYI